MLHKNVFIDKINLSSSPTTGDHRKDGKLSRQGCQIGQVIWMAEHGQANSNETTVDISSSGTVTNVKTDDENKNKSKNKKGNNTGNDSDTSQANSNETTVDISSSGTVTNVKTDDENKNNERRDMGKSNQSH
ncbi:MAG: hypothetical protein M3162_04625 [Thermoproteota archaeon]|nr:hypothetical protein [Thermoproteota archaeon]